MLSSDVYMSKSNGNTPLISQGTIYGPIRVQNVQIYPP